MNRLVVVSALCLSSIDGFVGACAEDVAAARSVVATYGNEFVYISSMARRTSDGKQLPSKGTMYRPTSEGTLEKYYTTSDFGFAEYHISYDGRYIVGFNPTTSDPSSSEFPCVGIAREGQVIKLFYPKDMIERPNDLKYLDHFGYVWIDERSPPKIENFFDFTLRTTEGKKMVIDITTGRYPSAFRSGRDREEESQRTKR